MQNRYKSLLLNSMLCWLLCYAATAAGQTAPTAQTPLPGDQQPDEPASAAQANPQQALSELLPTDEVVWLPAEDERVLALHIEEQSGSAKGGVIILTDYYHQPTERYWINNLRHTLPAKQWHSLVLAMPAQQVSLTSSAAPSTDTDTDTEQKPEVPASTETETEAKAPGDTTLDDSALGSNPVSMLDNKAEQQTNNQRRALAAIGAAINYLHSQEVFNIAIVSEGGSAVYALQYLSGASDPAQSKKILALALIDARNHFNGTSLIDLLATQTLPILDIYLGLDYRDRREAQHREVASRQLPADQYLQIAMPRIPTRWDSHEDRLSKRVRGWLDKLTK